MWGRMRPTERGMVGEMGGSRMEPVRCPHCHCLIRGTGGNLFGCDACGVSFQLIFTVSGWRLVRLSAAVAELLSHTA